MSDTTQAIIELRQSVDALTASNNARMSSIEARVQDGISSGTSAIKTDLLGSGSAQGTNMVTHLFPVTNALPLSAAIILNNSAITPQIFDKEAGKGGDDTYALQCFFAAMKEQKRKNGTIPRVGMGGYRTSVEQRIDFSNFCLTLEDNLISTSTTKSNCLLVTGSATTVEIENVSIEAPYPVTIDGNGWNMADYVYSTADAFYCALLLKWVRNYRIKNIKTINGLVGGILAFQCRGGVIDDPETSYTRFDNGLSINFDPGDYSDSDPSTWANATVNRLRAHHNSGFGATQYGASGVVLDSPFAWQNGNNVTNVGNPGPGGGISSERNGNFDKNHRCIIRNPVSIYNYGRSLFISASGTHAVGDGGLLKSARIPTNYTDTVGLYGNNVTVFGAENLSVATPVRDAERHNYFGLSTDSRYIDIEILGPVTGAAQRGIQFQGVKRLIVSGTVENNGLQVGATQVDGINVDNAGAAYNPGGGLVDISGVYRGNGGSAARIQNVLEVYFHDMRGRDNNANHSAQSAVYADYCGYVSAEGIDLRGANNTYVVTIGQNTLKALTKDVSGDATSAVVANSAAARLTSTNNNTRSSLTDQDYTTPSSAILVVSYAAALTANRTVTPNTINPTEGDQVIVYRAAGSSDPYFLQVGPAGSLRSLAPGQGVHYYRTGNAWVVISGGTVIPFDLTVFAAGKPAVSSTVMYAVAASPSSFFTSLTGSAAKAKTAATASTTFDIRKNGVSVGSMVFAPGATNATFTSAAGFSLAAGETVEVVAPSSQDATLADIAVTLRGIRGL